MAFGSGATAYTLAHVQAFEPSSVADIAPAHSAEIAPQKPSTTNTAKTAPPTLGGYPYAVFIWISYIAPPLMVLHLLLTGQFPSLIQLVVSPVVTISLIGISMSVCLHRFFSHGAFSTSRPFQFFLGLLSCLAYQNGPLWWAGKHNRHHRFCDVPNDPHSWLVSGWLQAWLGWTISAEEMHYDLDYIPPRFRKCPELWVLDRLSYWVCGAACWAVAATAGYSSMVYCCLYPMLLCRLITLLFNVAYHPKEAKGYNPDDVKCKALNRLNRATGVLASCVGEAHHLDHHKFPARAKRPGFDLYWHVTVRWWAAVGLIGAQKR